MLWYACLCVLCEGESEIDEKKKRRNDLYRMRNPNYRREFIQHYIDKKEHQYSSI